MFYCYTFSSDEFQGPILNSYKTTLEINIKKFTMTQAIVQTNVETVHERSRLVAPRPSSSLCPPPYAPVIYPCEISYSFTQQTHLHRIIIYSVVCKPLSLCS